MTRSTVSFATGSDCEDDHYWFKHARPDLCVQLARGSSSSNPQRRLPPSLPTKAQCQVAASSRSATRSFHRRVPFRLPLIKPPKPRKNAQSLRFRSSYRSALSGRSLIDWHHPIGQPASSHHAEATERGLRSAVASRSSLTAETQLAYPCTKRTYRVLHDPRIQSIV